MSRWYFLFYTNLQSTRTYNENMFLNKKLHIFHIFLIRMHYLHYVFHIILLAGIGEGACAFRSRQHFWWWKCGIQNKWACFGWAALKRVSTSKLCVCTELMHTSQGSSVGWSTWKSDTILYDALKASTCNLFLRLHWWDRWQSFDLYVYWVSYLPSSTNQSLVIVSWTLCCWCQSVLEAECNTWLYESILGKKKRWDGFCCVQ